MYNLQPQEADLIYKMIHDQDYLPTWDTLQNIFSNRSITQLHDLLTKLGKNIVAMTDVIPSIKILVKSISNIYHSIFIEKINNAIPSIGIFINDIFNIYQSIFTYMSIKDFENLFDSTQQVNCILQNQIKQLDNSSKVESKQNSIEPGHSTVKRPCVRGCYN